MLIDYVKWIFKYYFMVYMYWNIYRNWLKYFIDNLKYEKENWFCDLKI